MFSDPVAGNFFFGRTQIIETLLKRARALKEGYRQNVAIIGHEQLGKTSILHHFLHVLDDREILAIYVEIKSEPLKCFVDQFIRALLFRYLSDTEKMDGSLSLKELLGKTAAALPKTVSHIEETLRLLEQKKNEEAYSKLFDLTENLKQETGRRSIVILDEFHKLGELGLRNAFSDFGKRIMVQKDTMYLLASSSFIASRKILAEKLALLFGNFERIYLEPFDFETSFVFLEKRLAPRDIPEPLKSFLVVLTDGHPFFLDSLTTRLREIALEQSPGEITRKMVGLALLKLFFESQGFLNLYFLKLVSLRGAAAQSKEALRVLIQIAEGKNKLKDIAKTLGRTERETSKYLQLLLEHEILIKTGVFYRFHNRTLKFWVKEVYARKENSLLVGARERAEDFLCNMDERITEFEELTRMDITERVTRLFGKFKNDLVELGEKTRKLPHFTEFIQPEFLDPPKSNSARKLIAKGRGSCWACQITQQKTSEKEILKFVQDAPSGSRPAPTKVLIALNGLEDNAKLLAKEKRVLTLSLSKLNTLMDLYGEIPVIRV